MNGEPRAAPVLRSVRRVGPGSGLPWYFVSIGLGSNVSMCDGPPFMNRWTTCLASAAKCGAVAPADPMSPARGHDGAGLGAAALAGCPSAMTPARPISPKPMPQRPKQLAAVEQYDELGSSSWWQVCGMQQDRYHVIQTRRKILLRYRWSKNSHSIASVPIGKMPPEPNEPE